MKLSLYSHVKELFEYSESGVKRIPTGIASIDEKIRGVAPGEVCMILGRSYAGKSLMAQNIIANNAHVGSIFFSMEMPYTQALVRLYSIHNGANASDMMDRLEAGNLPDDLWEIVGDFPRHALVEEPNIGFDDMSAYLVEYERGFGHRPEFVVIDYLELLAGAKRSGEGFTAVDKVATTLKDWSKVEQMRVFVLHQCNRNEPRWLPPTESSPRFGGYTESDFVIGMWRPAFNPDLDYWERLDKRDIVNFNILKNRPFGQELDELPCRVGPTLKVEPI